MGLPMIVDVHSRGHVDPVFRFRRRSDLSKVLRRPSDHQESDVHVLARSPDRPEWESVRLRNLNRNQIGYTVNSHQEALDDGTAERMDREAAERHAAWQERQAAETLTAAGASA